jgi:uncharacterized protein YbjT (DUF2867 family)
MSTSTTPTILITGATGSVGTELVKQLSAKGVSFRALVRSMDKAGPLASFKNAEIISGDLGNAETVIRALDGIQHAFLLTNSSEQAEALQTNFVQMAGKAGVQQIVKLSQFAANHNSPVRFLRYHAAVEQQIVQSGMAYTFLRPNLYMQGFLGFRELIAKQGKFFATAGDAKISAVDIRDIAAVAVEALTNTRHVNKIYTLTGPESLTHQQMAEAFTQALGRTVQYINVSADQMYPALIQAGFPAWQAAGLIEDYDHYARGEAAEISSAIQDVTGKPARSFKEFAVDYAPFFS